jgi:hypothetical protein
VCAPADQRTNGSTHRMRSTTLRISSELTQSGTLEPLTKDLLSLRSRNIPTNLLFVHWGSQGSCQPSHDAFFEADCVEDDKSLCNLQIPLRHCAHGLNCQEKYRNKFVHSTQTVPKCTIQNRTFALHSALILRLEQKRYSPF